MVAKNTFRKAERLCSEIALTELYKHGEAFLCHPIRCVYLTVKSERPCVRVMISVPKRNHKSAVTRNLLKRRIRESYRLNRELLTIPQGLISVDFSLSYVSRDVAEYYNIENAVKKTLTELGNRLASAVD